ncbi:MAG TPA: hypothetical protein VE954_33025 [Oligoflexus sp.]|uniref:hypothetical protein n=1 Tax=Oligoflexus sp. TaxID=1971216 RepID=UPI002D5EDF61|nr:hypothetical protein [Oligoflexus sp.]HYX37949.1 hypothetical protein [Oligoflexus sp.]
MKRITLIGLLIVGLVAVVAVSVALNTGEKSPIYVAGSVEVPSEMRTHAEGIRTMFVTVFDEESPMPMPYGAMKETLPTDLSQPIDFALTKEKMQIMNPDARMPRYMRVKVRLDKDGMGGADQPGDLVGIVEHVQFGTSGVRLTIQQKI